MSSKLKERTLIIVKPDALQRGLLGEILHRFERKGIKIVGLKMMHLDDVLIEKHYFEHKDKPFFADIKSFMKQSPCAVLVLEGLEVVSVARNICGATSGRVAQPGTIRGDFSMSKGANIVHSSDSLESAEREINNFFTEEELFSYDRPDICQIYTEEERSK